MKKQYTKPATKVYNIEVSEILATSEGNDRSIYMDRNNKINDPYGDDEGFD